MRGTEGPEDKALSLHKGRVGEIYYRKIVRFEPLPTHTIRTAVDNDEILRLLVHHGQEDMHGVVDQPPSGLRENIAVDVGEDVLAYGLPDLAGKNL